ncbi:MAG: alpha/beta hydrolase [Gammaproteobacteria bacterium]|nr:alpha/beta hydrolase [Gammaproteobacteria bacterium]
MVLLRLLVWLVVLAPGLWWGWQALHAPPPALELEDGARLEWVDCWFERPWWRPIHCGRLHTAPEPGANPERFALPVVYLRQWFWKRRGPPVLYIAGGPGGSAWLKSDEIAFWLEWFDANDWPADLVLYDQRGVGLSQPAYDCPELRTVRRELLPLPLPTEETYRRVRDASRACHDRLRADGVDLHRFTTDLNVRDAIDLMRAMGLEQWDLYGVSYGSRVALEMMRRAPRLLRAAVLDSPYPPEVNGELADAWLLQRALELFGRICELAGECAQTPEELQTRLAEASERVRRESIKLSVRDPDTGRDIAVVYDDEDLAWLLFDAMYQWDLIPHLPESLRALAEGRLDSPMRSLIQDSVDNLLDDAISDPVASSVDCHDGGAVDLRDAEAQLQLYPRAAQIKRFDWQYHACRFWDSGEAPAAFRTPVVADVPTLLLAGEFDPVTPPEWAEDAVRHLRRGQVFVFPAVGHGVLDSHVCAAELVRDFFSDPNDPVVPKCLERL